MPAAPRAFSPVVLKRSYYSEKSKYHCQVNSASHSLSEVIQGYVMWLSLRLGLHSGPYELYFILAKV